LTALFTRKGIDDEMRRADKALVHGGSGLDGNELIHEGLVHAAAKLAEGLGQYKVGLRRIDLVVSEATGIHDGKVGPQALADILIGGTQFMLEQLQGEQDADRNGPSTTWGFFRESFVETLLDGADQSSPGEGVSPLTDGMHDGYKISDLQAGSGTAQPMLEIMNQAHREVSSCGGVRTVEYAERPHSTSPARGNKLVATM
jgi:hypothetical protein